MNLGPDGQASEASPIALRASASWLIERGLESGKLADVAVGDVLTRLAVDPGQQRKARRSGDTATTLGVQPMPLRSKKPQRIDLRLEPVAGCRQRGTSSKHSEKPEAVLDPEDELARAAAADSRDRPHRPGAQSAGDVLDIVSCRGKSASRTTSPGGILSSNSLCGSLPNRILRLHRRSISA